MLDHLPPQLFEGPTGIAFAALWGALWGSFCNVVIVRLPVGESLVRPRSHCRKCGNALRWYDNIPILSFLARRGRCRYCGARFSPRYMLVEALVAALAVLMHQLHVAQGSGAMGARVAAFVITSLFCALLVAISFIDLAEYRIPDAITYPAIPICVVLSLFLQPVRVWDGLVGAVAGYLVIRLIADGYEMLTGRLGMGYGDAKLLAMIGGLLGWQALLPTLLLAALQGSVIGIAALLVVRRLRGPQLPVDVSTDAAPQGDTDEVEGPTPLRLMRIPFGPFLALAAVETLALRGLLPRLLPWLAG